MINTILWLTGLFVWLLIIGAVGLAAAWMIRDILEDHRLIPTKRRKWRFWW